MSAQSLPQTLRADVDHLTDQQQEYENKDDPRETIRYYEKFKQKLERLDEVSELNSQNESRLGFVNERLQELRDLIEGAKKDHASNAEASTESDGDPTNEGSDLDLETENDTGFESAPDSDGPFEPSVPDLDLSEYVGRRKLKNELSSRILGPLRDSDKIERLGLSMPSGALLEGPPGTGKSRLVKALGGEEDLNYIKVKVPDIVDKYKGNTGKNIRNVFETAAENRPCIVCMDEVDALTGERGGDDSAGESRMVNVFLDELENAPEGVITFGTTNRPDIVDDAFKQKDRFEKCYTVDLPGAMMRFKLLKFYLKNRPHDLTRDTLTEAARQMEGYSCRDVSQVVSEASWDVYDKNQQQISPENLQTGIEAVTPLNYDHA